MPKGQKQCPKCQSFVGARVSQCSCGHEFKPATKKQSKPFFRERKEFIKRMLDGQNPEDMRLDIMVATKVFEWFDNDLDFLSKVKPPFKFKGSIKYLRSDAGRKYLTKKHKEFYYRPKNQEDFVEENDKIGEDIVTQSKQTIRDFLNGGKK